MTVIELVKEKYPITDALVFDEWESTLVELAQTCLPGVPQKVNHPPTHPPPQPTFSTIHSQPTHPPLPPLGEGRHGLLRRPPGA